MELPALPDGTAVQSHTDWLAQSPANQVAFYNHWDHNSESVVPIRVTHPGLVPWVPLLGGEASPHDPNVVALDLHVLDAIFARCFVVNDATVAARLHGHWLIAPARYGELLTALVAKGLDLSVSPAPDPKFALTVLVERIESMLPRLDAPFELRVDDMIPTVDEISVADQDLWQSKVPFGSLQPFSSHPRPRPRPQASGTCAKHAPHSPRSEHPPPGP